jgi:hypothetical protein
MQLLSHTLSAQTWREISNLRQFRLGKRLNAIITIDETDEGYRFTVAANGQIALTGMALSLQQAWEFCTVWADGVYAE